MRPELGWTLPELLVFASLTTWRYWQCALRKIYGLINACHGFSGGLMLTFYLHFVCVLVRMMKFLCSAKSVPKWFSWRTPWLRSARSTRCWGLSLSKRSPPTNKQVPLVSCHKAWHDIYLAPPINKKKRGIFLRVSLCVFLSPQGPINREMRHLISTLQTHNQQMKGEVVKFKLRLREAQQELNQVREICSQEKA